MRMTSQDQCLCRHIEPDRKDGVDGRQAIREGPGERDLDRLRGYGAQGGRGRVHHGAVLDHSQR